MIAAPDSNIAVKRSLTVAMIKSDEDSAQQIGQAPVDISFRRL
jgi:hypothetical protein